jgi:hypothetical protein
MKKFLSIFVALAMVLSLFAGVGARTAKAGAVSAVCIGHNETAKTITYHFSEPILLRQESDLGAGGAGQFTPVTPDKLAVYVLTAPNTWTEPAGTAPGVTVTSAVFDAAGTTLTITYTGSLVAGSSYVVDAYNYTMVDLATQTDILPANATNIVFTVPAAHTLTSITVNTNPTSVAVGGTATFAAIGTYSTAPSPVDITSSVTWATTTGTITAAGVLTAGTTVGSYYVTATLGAISGFAVVNVTAPVATLTSITITPNPATVIQSTGAHPFTATGHYSNLTTADISSAVGTVWATTTGSFAGAVLTAGATVGTYYVTATSGAISGFATVNVIAVPAHTLTSITITPNPATIQVGGTQQFVATGHYSDTTVTTDISGAVTWSANAPVGLFTGATVGTFYVTATSGAISGIATVNVIPAVTTPLSITVTPNPATVAVGGTQQFVATGNYATVPLTRDISAWVLWSANAPAGLFTGAAVGSVFVSASFGGITGFATVNVTAALPSASVTTGIVILDATGTKLMDSASGITQGYYDPNPTLTTEGTLDSLNDGDYVYNMGDIITGKLTSASGVATGVPAQAWKVSLVQFPYNVIDFTVVSGGIGTFTIGTANVHYDGPYFLYIESLAVVPEFTAFSVFNNDVPVVYPTDYNGFHYPVSTGTSHLYIKYNVAWVLNTITPCPQLQKISGYVTRGNGQTVDVPVFVGVAYPGVNADGSLASYYSVSAASSGQFAMTFLGQASPGLYRVFIMDGYYDTVSPVTPTNYSHGIIIGSTVDTFPLDHDAMVYKTISTIPTAFAMKAALFTSPVYLYKGTAGQSIVISLIDAFGAPVIGAKWYVEDTSGTVIADSDPATTLVNDPRFVGSAIDDGYYMFNIDTTSYTGTDLRFYFTSPLYGVAYTSNTIIVDLRDLSAWNPYLQVNLNVTPGPTAVCSLARSVYDNLPCTIGSGIWLKVGYWPPIAGYQQYAGGETVTFTGPLSWMGGARISDADGNVYYSVNTWYHFRITKAGAIGASIDETMWQQQDPAYPLDANNACCKTFTKTFTVCEVNSCTTTSIQLAGGAQTDASNVTVGSKSDLVISVDPTGAPADLFCGCNSKIVHIYMVNSSCAIVPGAFTVDTYGGGAAVTVPELWYNGIPESLIGYVSPLAGCTVTGKSADGSVTFQPTTAGIVAVDNCTTLTFKGVTFNFPIGTPCGYHLVVQVFGEERGYNQCGAGCPTFPFISESRDPIYVNPVSVTKTATATIYESGGVDPTQILAGVPATVEITDPGFSGETSSTWTDPSSTWSFSFKAAGTDTYYDFDTWGLPYPTVSKTDTGYRFSSFCMTQAGTIQIYNSSYNTNCMQFEELTVNIEVVMPTFSVKIGLGDATQLDNDNILTTGFGETVSVTATDPRTDVTHDFSTDSTWHLDAAGRKDSCGLQTAWVCLSSPTGCIGCAGGNALTITAYDNPCLEGAGTVRLYMVTACGSLKVSDFTVTDPTVTVTPATIPFTIPASATHVTFAVKDAHGHGAPGITVSISGNMIPASGASGYTWTAGSVQTGKDPMGEADWAFVPPFSGQYKVIAGTTPCTTVPPVWAGKYAALGATITAKYQAPVVDTTAPVIMITAGIDGSTVSTDVLALTGSVSDNVGISQLYVGFNKVDVLPDGSFMTNVKLAEGLNTITVVAYDAAGNKGTATVKVTYTPAISTKTVLVLTIGTDIVSVNGKATSIDAAPEIVAGRTFVPVRFIAESFGATVEWLPETQGITITLGDHTIGLQIGNSTAVIDGSIISLEAAPYIKNGRTMVPLRVISESFGGDVVWDPALRTITITYQP